MKHCPVLCWITFCSIAIILVFFLWNSQPIWAQSGSLNSLKDTVTSVGPAETLTHITSFQLPSAAQQITSSDYILIQYPNFTNLTASNSVGGTYTGTPSFSVDGDTVKVTGINVLPSKSIIIEGHTATNPNSYPSEFNFRVIVSEDDDGDLIKNIGNGIVTEITSGQVGVSANVDIPQARLQIQGYTAPYTYVIFTEEGAVQGTDVAGLSGYYSKLFASYPPGDHSINIYGIDEENRNTSIYDLDINTPVYQTTTISNILLSPTLEINSTSILQGNPIHATGSAYPGTTVTIFTDSPVRTYTASSSGVGAWTYSITDTNDYIVGDYRIYALAQTTDGLQSLTSPSFVFTITSSGGGGGGSACGEISQGDLNCDDTINLTDFSILMYYWGTTDATADINSDGTVNLTDFSIMMYYWGT